MCRIGLGGFMSFVISMYFWYCTLLQRIIEPYCNIGSGLRGLFDKCCLSLNANPPVFFICFLTELMILGLKYLYLLDLFVCLFFSIISYWVVWYVVVIFIPCRVNLLGLEGCVQSLLKREVADDVPDSMVLEESKYFRVHLRGMVLMLLYSHQIGGMLMPLTRV